MEEQSYPQLRVVGQTEVLHRGRRYVYFGGCDYFRLSIHPRVIAAAQRAAVDGLGVAASRVTTGNHPVYSAFERLLARHFKVEKAWITAHGYGANLAAAQSLKGRFTHAIIDQQAHVSLRDAAIFLGAEIQEFRHADPDSLERVHSQMPTDARVVVMTDGMFPLDGTVPPLADYLHRLGKDVWWWVDDCHAAGTLGRLGLGSVDHHGLPRSRVIQIITLSKAFGSFGGAILGDKDWVESIWKGSRWFAGSTPPPLPMVAAARTSLQILVRSTERLRRLRQNIARVKKPLFDSGILSAMSPGPMFLVTPESVTHTARLHRRLRSFGIYPSYIRYPGGPAVGAFRFAVSSEHSSEELNRLVQALVRA